MHVCRKEKEKQRKKITKHKLVNSIWYSSLLFVSQFISFLFLVLSLLFRRFLSAYIFHFSQIFFKSRLEYNNFFFWTVSVKQTKVWLLIDLRKIEERKPPHLFTEKYSSNVWPSVFFFLLSSLWLEVRTTKKILFFLHYLSRINRW